MSRHSPFKAYIPKADSTVILTMFPAFDALSTGNTSVLIKGIYSPDLSNSRDITVFVPPSLVENTLRRPINALIVLDGVFDTVDLLAKSGGFDFAVQTGMTPETVIIGVPAGTNGTACTQAGNSDPGRCSFLQRKYEFTPTVCNPTYNHCCNLGPKCPEPSGGAPILLDFVWNSIIPAVLEKLGHTLNEAGIVGWSLGGMTSCFAASYRPLNFSRAFCMSPSVWWNYGDMSTVIVDNAKRLKSTPKSVVIMVRPYHYFQFSLFIHYFIYFYLKVGSSENGYINGDLVPLDSNIPPTLWGDLILKMNNAWVAVGLGTSAMPALSPTELQVGLQSIEPSNLHYFVYNGGLHSLITWSTVFQYGLGIMYSFQYPEASRSQRNRNMIFQYPTVTACTSDNNDFSSTSPVFITLVCLLGFFFLTTVVLLLLYLGVCGSKNPPMSSRENEIPTKMSHSG